MKCLLIFNKLREVVFYDVDDEFVHVLRHKVALPLLRPQPLSSDDDVAAAIEYLGVSERRVCHFRTKEPFQ